MGLKRVNDEVWTFGTFARGSWSVRHVAHHEQLEMLDMYCSASEGQTLKQIEIALCDRFAGMSAGIARRVCEFWIEAGILWSSACLPAFFTDAWQALDSIIQSLPEFEQPHWRECREKLHSIAGKIETEIDSLETKTLQGLLEDAREAVGTMLDRHGAVVASSEDVFVVDRRAPFRFSISDDLADAIQVKLRRYWNFDRYGLGEIETKITIDHFFVGLSRRESSPLEDFLSRGGETDPSQRAWSWQERVLAKASAEHVQPAKVRGRVRS